MSDHDTVTCDQCGEPIVGRRVRTPVCKRCLHAGPRDLDALRALRERMQHQRDRRVRLLAADDAALRVIDEAIAEGTT